MPHLLQRLDGMPAGRREAALRLLASRPEKSDIHPLSHAQRQVWFLSQLHGPSPVYNLPFAFWLNGPLDVAALEVALRAVVGRHETLRTLYCDLDGEPFQVIVQPNDLPPAFTARSMRPDTADNDALVRRILDLEASTPMDLRTGPLVRARVLSAGPDRHLFLFTLHHIACDGSSMATLFGDLTRYYAAAVTGGEYAPPPPVRYVDYVRWQAAMLAGPARARHEAYWREQLAGAPGVLDFPAGLPRSSAPPVGEVLELRWDATTTDLVSRTVRREGCTVYGLLLAAYAATLYRQTGLSDIVIGTPVANRPTLEFEAVVGMFVNSVPLRLRMGPDMTFRDLLRQALAVALTGQDHQDLPFDLVVDAVRPQRTNDCHPVFQQLFTAQNKSFAALRFPGFDVINLMGRSGTAKVDLTVDVALDPDGADVFVEYDVSRFDDAGVRELVRHLRAVLTAAATDPNLALDALPAAGSVRVGS
jgi:hypothetical protein